ETFEQRAQIKLPASASDLEPLCGGIGAQAVQGTFNMNPGDLNRFMENAGLELPYSQTEYPEDDTFRFFPEKATVQSWLYQVHDDPLLFKQILIDTSNPSEYRVYINGLTG
ncbi:MAG TPA: hypothetical protein VJZ27_07645, partial [Aggregatilineales bacterium]|nr:hypothetical protein [Aggregatilineales bacterium]